MTALLAALLALSGVEGLLALPQETAEEAFKKVEAAIEGAKSIRVTFTIDSSNEGTRPGKGSLSIEEGGRVKLEGSLKSSDGERIPLSELCDGKKIVSTFDKSSAEALYDSKNGRSNYNVYLSRIGVLLGAAAMHGFYARAAKREALTSLDLKQFFQVKNVKFGESRKGMTGLTYELKSVMEPFPIDLVKIWYDPNNFKLARREYRIKVRNFDETIIEEYIDVQFDDGKAAAAPKEKPAPVSDAEMENLFFRSKLTVADAHLRAGRKEKAAEILEEIIKAYPKHPNIPDARRMLDEARKK